MLEFPMFVFYSYETQFMVFMLLLKACNAAFLYTQGYDKWYLGLVPFAHTYYKYELSGTIIVWFILDSIFGALFLLTFNVIVLIIWWVLRSIADYKYASIFIDNCNPIVFAVVPFGKYVIMLKEVIDYARNATR